MRSERKKGRSLLAKFMVLLMVINLLSGINPSAVRAEGDYFQNNGEFQKNGITISKNVTDYNEADGTYDIKLTVEGNNEVLQNKQDLDVVLVMDTSGSMGYPRNGWGVYTNERLNNAKKAAKHFVNTLLGSSEINVNIGLVSFAKAGKVEQTLTGNKNSLNAAIDKLEAKGGTYIQDGLEKAADMLKANNNHKKVMIVVGDGEPTYAKGMHPNFGKKDKEEGFYDAKLGETRDGYEQWHGNAFVWLGKGHHPKHRNYLVKQVYGEFGIGNKERDGWGKISWPYNLMDDYFNDATIAFAKTMHKNIQIFSVGIGVEDNNLAKMVMNNIATDGKYIGVDPLAAELKTILQNLAEKIQKRVSDGVVTDPMSEQVEYVDGSLSLLGEKDSVKTKFENNTLEVSKINLGKGEKLEISYKVKVKENWKDGKFHPANGVTTLKPNPKEDLMNFNVPMIKADETKITLTVNKKWTGPAPANLDELTFTVNNGTAVKVSRSQAGVDWTGSVELPKYSNGKAIDYTVTENKVDGYEQSVFKKTNDNDGNLTFTVTNKNVEKTSLKVIKNWENTPDELKFNVQVQLYEGDNPAQIKTIEKGQSEITFDGLDKYNSTGEEIEYTVKEVGENNGELTNGAYKFKVKYAPQLEGYNIVNTCTNPEALTFDVDLTKKWVGGIGKKATVTFKNENTNVEFKKELSRDSYPGENWTTTVSLPKYNSDNSKASYAVSEEEVKGFESSLSAEKVDFENTKLVVTNKRKMKDITVTKDWGKTPENLIKNITVQLLDGSGNVAARQDFIAGTTKHIFNVPETDLEGNEITYQVHEDGEKDSEINLDGKVFNVEYDQDNYTIRNTYSGLKTDTIKITVKKSWKDGQAKQAEFNIVDEKGEAVADQITLDNGNNWSVTREVPKYNKDSGKLAKYRVVEVENRAFTSKSDLAADEFISGENDKEEFTVNFTNTRNTDKLILRKEWLGNPGSEVKFTISPELDGEWKDKVNEALTLTPDNKLNGNDKVWQKEIVLPVATPDGNLIDYTITEQDMPGYQIEEGTHKFNFDNPADKTVTFKNTQVAQGDEKKYTIIKTWKGEPAESAYFHLYKNGTIKFGTALVLDKTNITVDNTGKVWTREIELKDPLPLYDGNGAQITYEIKEVDGPGQDSTVVEEGGKVTLGNRVYKVSYNGHEENTYRFTNSEIKDVSVTKTWEGTPQNAEFKLYKEVNGNLEEVNADPEIAKTDKQWKITYKEQPVTEADGTVIKYAIKEVDKDGNILKNDDIVNLGDSKYKVSYDNNGNITNTEVIDITVEKKWDDSVPDIARQSIGFKITENGQTHTLNEKDGWTKTFENLPLYKGSDKIDYSVIETKINGEKIKNLPDDDEYEYSHKAFDIELSDNAKHLDSKENAIKITNSIKKADPGQGDNRTINIVKSWGKTPENNRKPVTVKLYKINTDTLKLVPVEGKELTLDKDNDWTDKFVVPSKDGDEEIVYYAFETAIGTETTGELEFVPELYDSGYKIGEYAVKIAELNDYGFYILNEKDGVVDEPEETITINVTKQWADAVPAEYRKDVKVRLFVENGAYLVPVDDVADLTLKADNGWRGSFSNLEKIYDNEGEELKNQYHVAEVEVGSQKKATDVTLTEINAGYEISPYKVKIEDDGNNNVNIKNDIPYTTVRALKVWAERTPKLPAELTLYSYINGEFKQAATPVTVAGAADSEEAVFNAVPELDENGNKISYYVFETKIGTTPTGKVPAAEEASTYNVRVTGGTYTAKIILNGSPDRPIITNSYEADPTGPVVPNPNPGGDPGNNPGGDPGNNPGNNPGNTPGNVTPPTPGTDTATVDVPDDTTPQGDANINPSDDDTEDEDEEDGDIVNVDEDDIPEGSIGTEDPIDIDEDGTPQGTVEVDEDGTPQGNASLPKTGGTAADFIGLVGMGLIGLGLVIKRKK